MKTFTHKPIPYAQKIRWRLRALYLLLVVMAVYAVVISCMGGGDSRVLTDQAELYYRLIYFGGIIWIIHRITKNKRLLKDPMLLKKSILSEQDERNRYLHDKSGGLVWDVLFVGILFVTLTTALFDMAAFSAARVILLMAAAVKLTAYLYYSKTA